MMMTTGLRASTRESARASAPVDRDLVAFAVSWNPIPPAGVSAMEPVGRYVVPLAVPGADGRKSTQLIQLRKR